MSIDTTGFKVIKLPPDYPEGSVQGMARWRESKVDGSMRNVRHTQWKTFGDEFGVGSDKHAAIIDLGGSLAEDSLGFETPAHDGYWKPEWGPLPAPTAIGPAYHQTSRGITQEPNGKPIRIGNDNDRRTEKRRKQGN